jgi:hypothetical protein
MPKYFLELSIPAEVVQLVQQRTEPTGRFLVDYKLPLL